MAGPIKTKDIIDPEVAKEIIKLNRALRTLHATLEKLSDEFNIPKSEIFYEALELIKDSRQ